MAKIIGIDPGLNKTGWAVVQKHGNNSLGLISCGLISTKPSDPIAERLLQIYNGINLAVLSHKPGYSAIEETYVNKNYGSSLKLAHARASAILTLSLHGIIPQEYSAKTVKKTITGKGNAEKEQVGYMVKCLVSGVKDHSPDINDAIAVAICHSFYV